MSKPSRLFIPTISQPEFFQRLKERKFEDAGVIRSIEALFSKRRGYVFRMPKPGSPVILLVSGGLDSTVSWEILFSRYKLKVYPLFIVTHTKRSIKQEKVINFFADYFKYKYPEQFKPVMKFSINLSPPEILKAIQKGYQYYHPRRILDLLKENNLNFDTSIYPLRIVPFLNGFYGQIYAQDLYDRMDLKIKTIFTSVLAGDGCLLPSQSFSSLRSVLLSMCLATGDFDWQFASLALEKELGFWLYKRDMIFVGDQLGIPLEKTWSCYNDYLFQCGDKCQACQNRRNEFQCSHIADKTIYLSNLRLVRWARNLGILR